MGLGLRVWRFGRLSGLRVEGCKEFEDGLGLRVLTSEALGLLAAGLMKGLT